MDRQFRRNVFSKPVMQLFPWWLRAIMLGEAALVSDDKAHSYEADSMDGASPKILSPTAAAAAPQSPPRSARSARSGLADQSEPEQDRRSSLSPSRRSQIPRLVLNQDPPNPFPESREQAAVREKVARLEARSSRALSRVPENQLASPQASPRLNEPSVSPRPSPRLHHEGRSSPEVTPREASFHRKGSVDELVDLVRGAVSSSSSEKDCSTLRRRRATQAANLQRILNKKVSDATVTALVQTTWDTVHPMFAGARPVDLAKSAVSSVASAAGNAAGTAVRLPGRVAKGCFMMPFKVLYAVAPQGIKECVNEIWEAATSDLEISENPQSQASRKDRNS
eukprot:TRINITY_DN16799_c0_g1_i1.p1 TRINITY_DN16799_c0_g1~~TRINITY_DN16799_c0_g1_i1.p1  ORF type:complete len:389 (+),score=63.66 TRINITY_DN16799_c0_g1_i1:156-1169(+)